MSQNKYVGLLKESLSIGVVTVLIGLLIHFIVTKSIGFHDLNNTKMFAIHLFAIAVCVHLGYEVAGVNKWYCMNGVACTMQ